MVALATARKGATKTIKIQWELNSPPVIQYIVIVRRTRSERIF